MVASIINYCIIGIFASGKTSLASSFIKNKSSVTNESTIGASFIVNYTQTSGGRAIQLNIWDTAGQERYALLLPMYSRNADVIIFTVDPLNPESVPYIKKMVPVVMTDNVVAIHLVATKMDAQYGDKVAKEMIDDLRGFLSQFLRENDHVSVNDYYTSAITCYNVEQPFITNCDEIIIKKVERLTKAQSATIHLLNTSDTSSSSSSSKCIRCGV
jgi:Ras-related protein Rab-5C